MTIIIKDENDSKMTKLVIYYGNSIVDRRNEIFSVLVETEVNCKAEEMTDLTMRVYEEFDLKGETYPLPKNAIPSAFKVNPNTPNYFLFDALCNY
jgi:single-stranded DNA-specific DHH superfamily exonuclease